MDIETKKMVQDLPLGQRIKYYRKLRGFTQAELAEYIGKSRPIINKYENGTVEDISVITLEKIAKKLQVNPCVLAGWTRR